MGLFSTIAKFGGKASMVRGKIHQTAKFAAHGGLPQARGPEAILTKAALTVGARGVEAATKTDARALATGGALAAAGAYLASKLDW